MMKQINKSRQSLMMSLLAVFIALGAFGAAFAQDKYPKPNFSAMEEYYEIDSYEYDFVDRKFRVIAKPKQTVVPIWWNITWLDSKGVKIESFTIYFSSGEVSRVKVGEPIRGAAYCPFKRFMAQVKTVSIEENPDGGEAKTADYGTNKQTVNLDKPKNTDKPVKAAITENTGETKKIEKTTQKPTVATALMSGTAWSLRLYSKKKGYSGDGTVQTMLFCPDGTWDTVRYGFGSTGAVGQRGTYKMAGKNLTLKNGQGGQTENYAITNLNAGTFELSDGSDIIWRLFDGVKTDCK